MKKFLLTPLMLAALVGCAKGAEVTPEQKPTEEPGTPLTQEPDIDTIAPNIVSTGFLTINDSDNFDPIDFFYTNRRVIKKDLVLQYVTVTDNVSTLDNIDLRVVNDGLRFNEPTFEGEYLSLRVQASDEAGNRGVGFIKVIVNDNTAPTIVKRHNGTIKVFEGTTAEEFKKALINEHLIISDTYTRYRDLKISIDLDTVAFESALVGDYVPFTVTASEPIVGSTELRTRTEAFTVRIIPVMSRATEEQKVTVQANLQKNMTYVSLSASVSADELGNRYGKVGLTTVGNIVKLDADNETLYLAIEPGTILENSTLGTRVFVNVPGLKFIYSGTIALAQKQSEDSAVTNPIVIVKLDEVVLIGSEVTKEISASEMANHVYKIAGDTRATGELAAQLSEARFSINQDKFFVPTFNLDIDTDLLEATEVFVLSRTTSDVAITYALTPIEIKSFTENHKVEYILGGIFPRSYTFTTDSIHIMPVGKVARTAERGLLVIDIEGNAIAMVFPYSANGGLVPTEHGISAVYATTIVELLNSVL